MKIFTLLIKYFPIIKWSQEYKLSFLKNDIVAGLTVGITLIPQGLAYGSLAGLPPQYGLFAGLWGPFIYFFLGTSRDLTLGPTAILSLLVAHYSRLSGVPNDLTYAVLLALFTGIIQFLLGISKLGFLANYMSPAVVSGFTSSAAITIAWGQVNTLLGLKNVHSEFFYAIYDVFRKIEKANKSDAILGLCCIVVLLFFKILSRKLSPGTTEELSLFQRITYKTVWFLCIGANIIVLVLATLFALALEVYDIPRFSFVGKIGNSLPVFDWPKFKVMDGNITVKNTKEVFMDIGPGIPIIALIALVEALAIGKSFARKNGYKIRSSQEFIAIGFTNIFASMFQAFPATGSFSRTAINSQCSSKSPFSGVLTGSMVIVSLRFLTPLFVHIPKTSLSAIIIVAVLFMTDFRYLLRIWRLNKYDFSTWIITFIMSISFGVEYGVFSGIAYSFLPIILNASQPTFVVKEHSSTFNGSYLWFPFCSRLMAMIESTDLDSSRYSILNLVGVYSIDSAVINTIQDIGYDFQKRKKALIVISDKISILSKLSNDSDQCSGMHCFRSHHDAQLFYQNFIATEWIGENLSLISIH